MPHIDLDSPPSPDEGEITSVEFEAVYPLERHPSTCQACGGEVDRNEPHAKAVVWIHTPPVMQTDQRMKTIYFCDRTCWMSWACVN